MPYIAVVDDEEPVRKALGRLLRASGMEVECYAGGRDFLDAALGRRPDCVILDLHMPRMSGMQVLAELRGRYPRLPVLVITAHDSPEVRSQCLAAGARAYLRKPLDAAVLLDAIKSTLTGKSTTENSP